MKIPKRLLVLFVPMILFSCTFDSYGQRPTCDSECMRTVRNLLKASYIGVSLTWLEKANYSLGDKIGVAVPKIYKGKSLYTADNIRTFLPVIKDSFFDRSMIDQESERNARVTIALLKRLQARVKDHFLNREITLTLNGLMFSPATETTVLPKP
jgi:hypothetical protein